MVPHGDSPVALWLASDVVGDYNLFITVGDGSSTVFATADAIHVRALGTVAVAAYLDTAPDVALQAPV